MNKNSVQICAFCSKQKAEVNMLITGNSGNICDICVKQADSIINEERIASSSQKIKKDLELFKPVEIKAHLDQYVIGQDTTKKVLLKSIIKMDGIIRMVLLRKYYRFGKLAFSSQKSIIMAGVPLFFMNH